MFLKFVVYLLCILASSLPYTSALLGIETEYWIQAVHEMIKNGEAEKAWSSIQEIHSQFQVPKDVKSYVAALSDEWNSNIKTSPSYVWALKFGSLTQIMRVDLSWDELNTQRPERYVKKRRTLFYTLTPEFVFSWGVTYIDRVRVLTKSTDIEAAHHFIKDSKGFQMGEATAFSLSGQRSEEIIDVSKSDSFQGEWGKTNEPSEYTSLARVVLHALITHQSTDFDVAIGVGGWRSRIDEVLNSGIRWNRPDKKRNIRATARITGEYSYLYRHWLLVPLTGGKAWWRLVPPIMHF